MIRFKEFLKEELIEYSKEPNTMSFYHGGNLDDAYDETIAHKRGRFEYGPGLYLTTHYDTAKKYAKGSRKFYLITIKKGTNLDEVSIALDDAIKFVNSFVIKAKRKDIIGRFEKRGKDGRIPGYIFSNVIINEDAVKPSDTDKLRKFLIEQGADYSIVNSPFGWGEIMIVLFNMKNIISKVIIKSNDKVEAYDLPTKFN